MNNLLQVSALEALKGHDHTLLCNLLTEETITLEIDKEYQEENYKTLLHLAVEREDLVGPNFLKKKKY